MSAKMRKYFTRGFTAIGVVTVAAYGVKSLVGGGIRKVKTIYAWAMPVARSSNK